MPIEVQIGDTGQIVEFPDGTSPEVMNQALAQFSQQQGGKNDSGMGTGGNAGDNNMAPMVAEQSFGREMLSGLELAGTMGSAAVMEPVAGIAGGLAALNPLADEGAGARVVETVRGMAYEPRMAETKRALEGIGGAASDVGEFVAENVTKPLGVDDLSGRTLEATGSPALATLVDVVPVAIASMLPATSAIKNVVGGTKDKIVDSRRYAKESKKLIADEVRKGNPQIDLVTKVLDENGNLTRSPASKSAVNQLSRVINKDRVKGAVAVMENMSTGSKKIFNDMLNDVKRGNNEPMFKVSNPISNRVGQAISARAQSIKDINANASERIGKIAESLENKNVDISAPIRQFENKLREFGVTFSRGDDGWITPDFSRSKFKGGNQKDMTVLVNDLLNTNPSFLKAHDLKREIRGNLDYDVGGKDKITGDSERALKQLSSGIDEVLDSTSKAYKESNETFADTIKIKEDWQKLAGKDVDFNSPISFEKLGLIGRRLDSNATSSAAIRGLIEQTNETLGKYGKRPTDDVFHLNYMSTQLEDLFGLTKSNSFQGGIERANRGSAGLVGTLEPSAITAVAVDEGVGRLAKMRKPNFNKKLQILRELNKQKAK